MEARRFILGHLGWSYFRWNWLGLLSFYAFSRNILKYFIFFRVIFFRRQSNFNIEKIIHQMTAEPSDILNLMSLQSPSNSTFEGPDQIHLLKLICNSFLTFRIGFSWFSFGLETFYSKSVKGIEWRNRKIHMVWTVYRNQHQSIDECLPSYQRSRSQGKLTFMSIRCFGWLRLSLSHGHGPWKKEISDKPDPSGP